MLYSDNRCASAIRDGVVDYVETTQSFVQPDLKVHVCIRSATLCTPLDIEHSVRSSSTDRGVDTTVRPAEPVCSRIEIVPVGRDSMAEAGARQATAVRCVGVRHEAEHPVSTGNRRGECVII